MTVHERTRRIFTKDSKSEKRKRGRERERKRERERAREKERERERVERTANDKRSVGQRAPKNIVGSLLLRQYDGVQTPS